jgi:hypothetical protein
MEKIHNIKTETFKDERLVESSTLKIYSLNIEKASELTDKILIKELQIQRNNLGMINEDNLSGYLTPRDIQRSLRIVQENINNLVMLLIERKN